MPQSSERGLPRFPIYAPACLSYFFRPPAVLLPLPLLAAERAIRAGEQILHTYGDLPDAQLAALYGFMDAPLEPLLSAAASGQLPRAPPKAKDKDDGGKGGKAKAGGARRGLGADAAAGPSSSSGSGGAEELFINPYTAAMVPWVEVEAAAASVLARMGEVRCAEAEATDHHTAELPACRQPATCGASSCHAATWIAACPALAHVMHPCLRDGRTGDARALIEF